MIDTGDLVDCDVCEVGKVKAVDDPYGTAQIAICADCNGGEEIYGPVILDPAGEYDEEADRKGEEDQLARDEAEYAAYEAAQGDWEAYASSDIGRRELEQEVREWDERQARFNLTCDFGELGDCLEDVVYGVPFNDEMQVVPF